MICKIATAPAAAVPPSMLVVSVQNGPIMLHNPTAANVIAHSAATSECAHAAHANPTAASIRHPAICHRRSLRLSELHPTTTVITAAARYGNVAYRAIKLASLAPP